MRTIPNRLRYLTLGLQVVELDGEAMLPCGRKNVPGVGLGHLQLCPAPFPVCSICLVFAVGCDFLPFSLQTVKEMNRTWDIRQKFKLSFKEYLTPTYEYMPSREITYALYIHNMVRVKRTPPWPVTNLDMSSTLKPMWSTCSGELAHSP